VINRISSLFLRTKDTELLQEHSPDNRHLAAAVILVEAACTDGTFDEAEKIAIENALRIGFELNDNEVSHLLELAQSKQDEANDLIQFTRKIKDSFSESERIELIEMLWEIIYSDGILHEFELNLMRRVGGLLYVSDQDRGKARKRVLARLEANT